MKIKLCLFLINQLGRYTIISDPKIIIIITIKVLKLETTVLFIDRLCSRLLLILRQLRCSISGLHCSISGLAVDQLIIIFVLQNPP